MIAFHACTCVTITIAGVAFDPMPSFDSIELRPDPPRLALPPRRKQRMPRPRRPGVPLWRRWPTALDAWRGER